MTYDPGVVGGLGCRIYLGTTASNGSSDTYAEIGHTESISAFGASYNIVTFIPMVDGATEKFKGARDDGDISVVVGRDQNDAGQAACLTALAYTGALYYNLKILHNDASSATAAAPTKILMKVKVVKFTETPGSAGTVIKGEITFAVKSNSIAYTAAT